MRLFDYNVTSPTQRQGSDSRPNGPVAEMHEGVRERLSRACNGERAKKQFPDGFPFEQCFTDIWDKEKKLYGRPELHEY